MSRENPIEEITTLISQQKAYFASGATRSLAFREAMLRRLMQALQAGEAGILAALAADFGKPAFETYATEIGVLLSEIRFTLRNLGKWIKPKKVKPSLFNFPSKDAIHLEPYGVSLIVGAWNYPFQLTLAPVVGSIGAGGCAMLKPSELTPATSELVARLIRQHFPPEYLTVVQGDAQVSQALLQLPFDKIFFTGSIPVGRIVAEAAARQLIPVTLELGGKSPCLVDETADLKLSARRIAWGKFLNAGQTCVAPDYLLVQESILPALLEQLAATLTEFYGPDPAQSPDYARIINQKHFGRLRQLMQSAHIYAGGQTDTARLYIAPTLLTEVSWQHPLMQEEIFGPLLPVLPYRHLADAIAQVQAQPKPLALYLFSRNKENQRAVLTQTSSGACCINETVSHLANPHLPFGGVGTSGQGNYHGKASIEAFSHQKSVLKKPFLPDLPLRYPPYSPDKLKWVKKAFHWF